MPCPFCKARADLADEPLSMFTAGIGLGILMHKHPTKMVDVCRAHMAMAREVSSALGETLNWTTEGMS